MNEDEVRAQLDEEYDRIIAETLRQLQKSKPLTRAKIAEALMKANKAYWTARLAILDDAALVQTERVAAVLAVPYAHAAEKLARQVQNVFAGYQSAFGLTQKDAKDLLGHVVYDRSIADNLRTIAESMTDSEEKTRILAEISAPAYRYRMQRAEQIAKNAQETLENIARVEIAADRKFLQTETEKAYNIVLDEAKRLPPSEAVVIDLDPAAVPAKAPAPINTMPRADEPIRDFTPTTDRGIMDSFALTNTKAVNEIIDHDWKGVNFSERIWDNTDELSQEVKRVLLNGELTGASEAEMAAEIRDKFGSGMYQAARVVRTEHTYCTNQAELKGLADAGFDEYEFMPAGESNGACDTCDDLDGQRFKIADAVVGVNLPPMHPNCRCTIGAVMESDEDVQAEIDRLLDGRSIEDIERELDRQIEDRDSTLNSVQESANSAEENQLKMLTTDNNSDIMGLSDIQTENHIKTDMYDQDVVLYDITDERINSIEPLNLSSLDDETNKKLTNECKLLLDYVRNEKTGTEAAFVFDNNMGNKQEFKAPDDKGHVNFACSTDKSIVIHNHPDGLLFSEADLQRFNDDDKILVLGAIGNNGSTYFVEKSSKYDSIGFYDFLGIKRKEFPLDMTGEEQLKYSECILKECEKYGINVYTKKN